MTKVYQPVTRKSEPLAQFDRFFCHPNPAALEQFSHFSSFSKLILSSNSEPVSRRMDLIVRSILIDQKALANQIPAFLLLLFVQKVEFFLT